MVTTPSSEARQRGRPVVTMTSSISSEDYERLALELLAVEAGDFADVKDAMRKIIASAPDGADVAFLLSRALAHAGDRASKGEVHESERPRNTVAMVGYGGRACPGRGGSVLVSGRPRPSDSG